MNPKVSIILPTYNVEKYFRQCLDSIVNQTLSDIEIIPVDDGSPDNCGKIMDEYAQKDSRIKPIHQQNGGYGKAVNAGLNAATGEYIGIIETDDWCNPDMFEKLYNQAKSLNADICKGDFNYYLGDNNFKPNNTLHLVSDENVVFTIKENPLIMRYHASIWSAIYRRDYLNSNNIRVLETAKASYQDMPFAALVYAKGGKITLLHEALLNYRFEEGMDSSTKRTDERLKLMPRMCNQAKTYFLENNCWNEVKEVAYRHFCNCSLGMWFDIDDEFRKPCYEELRNLFKNIPDENIEYKYINNEQKKILQMIINDEYDKLLSFTHKKKKKMKLKKLRQNMFSIHCKKNDISVMIMGKKFILKRGFNEG